MPRQHSRFSFSKSTLGVSSADNIAFNRSKRFRSPYIRSVDGAAASSRGELDDLWQDFSETDEELVVSREFLAGALAEDSEDRLRLGPAVLASKSGSFG